MYTSDLMSWRCASRTAATTPTRMRETSSCQVAGSLATGSPSCTTRRSLTCSPSGGVGPVKGRWLLGNGGHGLVPNNQGMEASWWCDRNAIGGDRQVLGGGAEEKRQGGKGRGGRWGLEKGEGGVGRFPFSSTLHADGSPQCLSVSTQSGCFGLDHNVELACRDSAPHHCIEGQWINMESGSGSTHKLTQRTKRTCTF